MKQILLISLFLLVTLTACQSSVEEITGKEVTTVDGSYKNITPVDLDTMLKNTDLILVNVHTPFAGNIADTDLSIPYDQISAPENLAQLCASETQEMQAVRIVPTVTPRQKSLQLPMLEWLHIPAGMLLISESSQATANRPLRTLQHTLQVDSFRIAKYPVTNQQYQYFLDDEEGYCNPRWWGYSPYAQAWFQANPTPAQGQYKGEERPRENVTWFEAMAYCYWLSSKLDLPITLPSKQQWRRAAQGDGVDRRYERERRDDDLIPSLQIQ